MPRPLLWLIAALATSALPQVAARGQPQQPNPGEQSALAARPAVVKIAATLAPGATPQFGFGFVIGERGEQLVIVTADHVVRGEDPGAEDQAPLITFFQDQGTPAKGALQATRLPRERGDLAVILVHRPSAVNFVPMPQASTQPVRGDPVWLVGRGGEWNVPVRPGLVSGVDFDGRIRVEGLGARLGSSGGPLISPDGVVGMIVADSELATEATSIAAIRRQVQDGWQYPWQLVPRAAPATAAIAAAKPVTVAPPALAPAVRPLMMNPLVLQQGPASSPAPAPVPAQDPLARRAAELVQQYMAVWSQTNANALPGMASFYADQVTYYGKLTPRSAVLEEKRKFAERWPGRVYSVRPNTSSVRCDDRTSTCTVTCVVDWEAESQARNSRSTGAANVTFEISALVPPRIVGETSSVIGAPVTGPARGVVQSIGR